MRFLLLALAKALAAVALAVCATRSSLVLGGLGGMVKAGVRFCGVVMKSGGEEGAVWKSALGLWRALADALQQGAGQEPQNELGHRANQVERRPLGDQCIGERKEERV